MIHIWHYLNNQFLSETDRNFLKALKLAEYTDAALHSRIGDPFFAAQYAFFHPFYDSYNTIFDTWDTQKGTQKGETSSVTALIKQLSPVKINQWDLATQTAGIAKGTPNYIAIFPRGHKPYQTGDTITRINAVNSLSMAIALQIPPLAPPTHPLVILKNDVDTFYTLASNTYSSQQGEISDTGADSDAVDAARVKAMVGLYAVLGACMNKFADDPTVIEPLFNLELLRSHTQMDFTGHVKINGVHTIVKRTLEPTAMVTLRNTGVTELHFYLAHVKDAHIVPPAVPVIVVPGDEVTIPMSSLGDATINHFLMVFNADLVNKGEWEVEFA